MEPRTIQDVLARVEQLDRDTPGPWDLDYCVNGAYQISQGVYGDQLVLAHRDEFPARAIELANVAMFIAESRELLPLLAAEVRRIQGEKDKLERLLLEIFEPWYSVHDDHSCSCYDEVFPADCNVEKVRAALSRREGK